MAMARPFQLERIQDNNVRSSWERKKWSSNDVWQNKCKCDNGYDTVSDRILSVRFRGRKVNITIIQVCAPTSTALDVYSFFQQTTKLHRQNP